MKRDCFRFHLHEQHVDVFVEFLESQGIFFLSWYEDETSFSTQCDENGFPKALFFWVDIYLEQGMNENALWEVLARFLGPFPIPSYEKVLQDDKDWVHNYIRFSQKVGDFWLNPPNENMSSIPPSSIVWVEAATAFGSGEHPTTQGCIRALCDFSKYSSPRAILDLGCGSGILALCAKRLFPNAHVVACDIDPESVTMTRHNSERNRCTLDVMQSAGFSNAKTRCDYGLVVANILARPLQSLAKDIKEHLSSEGGDGRGVVILSGLLSRQVSVVLRAYVYQGLYLKRSYTISDWVTLVLHQGEK